MNEIRECSKCGREFQVIPHPLTVCPTCDAEAEARARVERQRVDRHRLSLALSWTALICGLTGMVLSLLVLLK